MKEVCGFEDSKGRFHRTKESVEQAEAEIKLLSLQKGLERFTYDLARLLQVSHSVNGYLPDLPPVELHRHFHNELDGVYEKVADVVLRNSEIFLKLIESKKTLQKEYDILAKKTHRTDWWLKYVWWK